MTDGQSDADYGRDRCPSCGRLWTDHPGIIPTCRENAELRAALHEIVYLTTGPLMVREASRWEAAMNEAARLLRKDDER